VTGSCGTVTEANASVNVYNLLSPALSLTAPAALTNAVVGQTATRTASITNGGNGCLDTAYYYVVYPGGGVVNTDPANTITANGTSFTPTAVHGDTLFYKIYGATLFGGDNLLCNGERVTIVENIRVIKCNTTTAYGVAWGHGSHCQLATGSSVMTMAAGVASIGSSFTRIQEMNWCQKGIYNLTYTNTGSGGNAGAAYNVLANIGYTHQSATAIPEGIYPSIITRVDSIKIGSVSVPVLPITSTQPARADFSGLTSDPDGAGTGLEDLDGDGQFDDLAPGQSVTVTVYEHWTDNSLTCPLQPYYIFGTHTLGYTSMCGTALTTNVLSLTGAYRLGSIASTVIAPPEVEGGKPFTVQLCVELGSLNRPNYKPKDSLYFDMVLPAGVSLSGSGNITYSGLSIAAAGGSVSTSTTGGITTVHIMRKGADQRYCFTADLVYDCAAGGGSIDLGMNNYYVGDLCAASRENYVCTNKTVRAICSDPCPLGGMLNHTPQATRLSLGYTDGTMTAKVAATSVTGIAKYSGLPLDTFSIIVPGVEHALVDSFSNLYYDLQLGKANSENVFQYLSGTFYQYRDGAIIASNPLAAPVDGGSTSALQLMHWDISSNLAGGAIHNGDSVWLDLRLVVTKANGGQLYGTTLTQVPSVASSMYNLDGTTKLGCGMGHSIGMLVAGTSVLQATLSGAVIAGCASQVVTSGLYIGNTTTFDIFPNEFRPYAVADSILITLPVGYSMVANRYNTITWSSLVNYLSTPANTTGIVTQVSANKWMIKNPNLASGGWLAADLVANGAANYGLAFDVVATCAAATGSQPASIDWYYRTDAYAGAGNYTSKKSTGNGNLSYNIANKPAISVQNNTGTVQGIQPQHYWDVQINSTATVAASYVWMALEQNAASGIAIDSVVLKPSNVVLTPLGYGGRNTWYQLSAAGLAGGASQQARIYFKYNNCTTDSILLRSGWNCTGYPTDPAAYACTASSQVLKVVPENSQVQIAIGRQVAGGGTLDLCATDSVMVVVNSAQAANVGNPYVVIYPPAGINITSPVAIEYPLGSNDWQVITPVSIAGGGYQFNLKDHTGIGANGLPGTALNPASAERQARIKVPVSASCSFVSGSQLAFTVHGAKPCGDPASGEGLSVNTNPVNITGATAIGNAAMDLTLSGANTLRCGDATTLNFSVMELGTASIEGDTAVYTLPAGLAYVTGSFTGCAACAVTTTPAAGGSTLVKVAIPAGLASGSITNFSFDVQPSGAGCGTLAVSGQVERNITGLSCGAIVCTASKMIIGTGTPVAITLAKPVLAITGLSRVRGLLEPGKSITLNITVANTATVAAPASDYVVEFFCNSGTTPFATATFPNAIAAGSSSTAEMTMAIPAPPVCLTGDFVNARIRPLTDAGLSQCLCSETAFAMGVVLPVRLTSFSGFAKDCKAVLNWQTQSGQAQSHFDIEYSTDGNSFSKAGTVACGNNPSGGRYQFEYPLPQSKTYFRLNMVGNDGTHAYSNTIAVVSDCIGAVPALYPNPAKEQVTITQLQPGNIIRV
jgi:hypothetical protein